jgi:hypothetical protein
LLMPKISKEKWNNFYQPVPTTPADPAINSNPAAFRHSSRFTNSASLCYN